MLLSYLRGAVWPDIRHQTNPAIASGKTQSFNCESLSIRDRGRRRKGGGGGGGGGGEEVSVFESLFLTFKVE